MKFFWEVAGRFLILWLVLSFGVSKGATNNQQLSSVPQLPPRVASGPPQPSGAHLNIIGSSQDAGATKTSPTPASIYPSPTSPLSNSIYQPSSQPPIPTMGPFLRPNQPLIIETPRPNYPPHASYPPQPNYPSQPSYPPQPLYSPQPNYPPPPQRPPVLQMSVQAGPTPVIMQYLPQSQMSGGVQYLQLIPTRPLIVPISPYITQLSPQQQDVASNSVHPSAVSDQASRTTITNATNLPPQPQRGQILNQPPFRNYQQINPVGSYASQAPVYAYFRPNSGMEVVEAPQNLDLNTNEFIPGPGDVLPRFARGRP